MSKKERSLDTVVSPLPAKIAAQDKQQRTLDTVVSKLPAEIAAKDKQQRTYATVVSTLPAELAAKDAALNIVTDDATTLDRDVDVDDGAPSEGLTEPSGLLDVGDVTKADPITPATTLEVPTVRAEETELVTPVPPPRPKARRQSRKLVAALVVAVLLGVGTAFVMTRTSSSPQRVHDRSWVIHDAAVTAVDEPAGDAATADATNTTTNDAPLDAGVTPPRKKPASGEGHRKRNKDSRDKDNRDKDNKDKHWDPDTLFPP